MKPSFLNFPMPIWRVMPDTGRSGLAIELRSREEKVVRFFYLDLTTHQQVTIATENDWWKGLLAVQNSLLLLHGYESPGMPIHQGLYVFDGRSGNTLWALSSHTCEKLAEDYVLLKSPTGEVYGYSLKDGTALAEIPEDSIFTAYEEQKISQLAFPRIYTQDHQDFKSHAQKLSRIWQLSPRLQIDWLSYSGQERKKQGNPDTNAYQIYTCYSQSSPEDLNQELCISQAGKRIFQRQIGKKIAGLSIDPFFVFKDYLIWIENQQRLAYLRLG